MKKIYFKKNKKETLSKKVVRFITFMAATIFPKFTLLVAYKVIANPFSKRRYEFKAVTPDGAIESDTKLGKVKAHYFDGGDKHILLTHGWADTSKSFQTIIEKLLNEGYTVWSLDHIGHGVSEGSISHVFGYIEGLSATIAKIEKKHGPLHGIISHSMGGIAVLNQDEEFLSSKKVIIMAVPFNFFDTIFKLIDDVGISKKVFSLLVKHLEKTYGRSAPTVNLENHTHKFKDNILFIHDTDDEHCPYSDVYEHVPTSASMLISTNGLGHRGLFKDSKASDAVLEFLKEP